jgi:hypothetical protein
MDSRRGESNDAIQYLEDAVKLEAHAEIYFYYEAMHFFSTSQLKEA